MSRCKHTDGRLELREAQYLSYIVRHLTLRPSVAPLPPQPPCCCSRIRDSVCRVANPVFREPPQGLPNEPRTGSDVPNGCLCTARRPLHHFTFGQHSWSIIKRINFIAYNSWQAFCPVGHGTKLLIHITLLLAQNKQYYL